MLHFRCLFMLETFKTNVLRQQQCFNARAQLVGGDWLTNTHTQKMEAGQTAIVRTTGKAISAPLLQGEKGVRLRFART